jgi:hypothetical protein
MVTSGAEIGFWNDLGKYFDTGWAPLILSDSHAYAIRPAQDADTIILFDAHHDCWKDEKLKEGQYACHTWLGQWLEENPSSEAYWVYPTEEAAELADNIREGVADRLTPILWESFDDHFTPGQEADLLHICRSGCWTAPWLDKAFIDFVETSGRRIGEGIVLQEGIWDPTKERWTQEQFEEYQRAEDKRRKLMEEMK